jgi:ABC-type multidrug transport system ATPase subunit
VAKKRVGQFSLGMGQRLGIASALLGDPATLILDEPINGLDPGGIHWMRGLLKTLAAEGRTVFLSSHLMNEMALTADHLIIIGRGRLIRDTSIGEFVRESSKNVVRVRSPQADQLRGLVVTHKASISSKEPGLLDVEGLTAEQIGGFGAVDRRHIPISPRSLALTSGGCIDSLAGVAEIGTLLATASRTRGRDLSEQGERHPEQLADPALAAPTHEEIH